MKAVKKINAVLLALVFYVLCVPMTAYAADGSITFTDPETEVGEMVDVKCVVRSDTGELGDVEISLSYDSSSLRFESGEGVSENGSGSLIYSGTGGASEVSFTMQFQALAEGSTKVSLTDVSVTSGYGATLSFEEGDSTVSIGPGDPSKIKTGTAAPAASAGDMQVEVNGMSYTLTDNFADTDIPSGYTRTSVTLDGQERQLVTNESGTIYLGYLLDAQNSGEFYIYNNENATFSPYEEIAISDTTSIVVLSDTSKVKLPDSYQEAKLTLNDKEFPVWQDNEHDGYYILYAMNTSGKTGYYQYDVGEGTYQRVEISAKEEKKEEDGSLTGKIRGLLDKHLQLMVVIMGLGSLAVFVLIIVLAVKLRNRNLELDDLYDEYGIDMDDEEPEGSAAKDKKSKSAGTAKAGRHKYQDNFFEDEEDFDEDDFDEDGFDEEDFDEDDFDEDGFDEEDFDEDDFDEDDFDEDDFEEEKLQKKPSVRKRPGKSASGGNDFGADTSGGYEDDIFSDKNIKKYDTKAVRRSMRISELDDTDGLGELMEDLAMERPGHQEKDDAFKVDIVDLD
ncbi:MAG: cohesin domain-containing protein [Lachnospiraceae bacterium]